MAVVGSEWPHAPGQVVALGGINQLQVEPVPEEDPEDHVPPVDPVTAGHEPDGGLAESRQRIPNPALEASDAHLIIITNPSSLPGRSYRQLRIPAHPSCVPASIRGGCGIDLADLPGPERDRPRAGPWRNPRPGTGIVLILQPATQERTGGRRLASGREPFQATQTRRRIAGIHPSIWDRSRISA